MEFSELKKQTIMMFFSKVKLKYRETKDHHLSTSSEEISLFSISEISLFSHHELEQVGIQIHVIIYAHLIHMGNRRIIGVFHMKTTFFGVANGQLTKSTLDLKNL